MDRTRFLRTCTLLAAGSLLGGQPALAALAGAQTNPVPPPRFRPGPEGQILVTRDEGATWQTHLKLGPGFTVENIHQENQGQVAYINYKGLSFTLKLTADGKSWGTA